MGRQIDLISYLPQFIQAYREIKQIMSSENLEMQDIENKIETTKNNQFIISCDAQGIEHFENLLGITPNSFDNLQARISRVISRWNDGMPYTYRGLIQKLNTLCGENNYILIPKFNEYKLELVVSLPLSGQVEELEYILSYMIPANIVVNISNQIKREPHGTVYMGGVTVERNIFSISTLEKENSVQTNYTSKTVSKQQKKKNRNKR